MTHMSLDYCCVQFKHVHLIGRVDKASWCKTNVHEAWLLTSHTSYVIILLHWTPTCIWVVYDTASCVFVHSLVFVVCGMLFSEMSIFYKEISWQTASTPTIEGQDIPQFDTSAQIVCGVGYAHNMAIYLIPLWVAKAYQHTCKIYVHGIR